MIEIYEKNSPENLEFNANVIFKLFCSVQICWVEWVELGRVPTLLIVCLEILKFKLGCFLHSGKSRKTGFFRKWHFCHMVSGEDMYRAMSTIFG
jgi:hypothetical protein